MPGSQNPNIFDPPSAEQLAKHLAANPPARTPQWQTRLPLMVLAIVGMTLLLMSGPAFALLPWLAVMGLMVFLVSKARAARELEQKVTRAWELAMIRRYREALGRSWELIPLCRTRPELHGRVVTVIAHVLGELKQDEAAEIAYSYLIDHLPTDHPLALRLQVQRAIAALDADRLADADDALRKLRGPTEAASDPVLSGAYHLARLVQDVRTGHFADAAQQADQTADALRPLGVEAGYGHGLLALCFQSLAIHGPANDDAQEQSRLFARAKTWWDNATILIPPAALVYRHPELADVPARFPTQNNAETASD